MIERLLKLHRYPEYLRTLFWRKLLPLWVRGPSVKIGSGVILLGMPTVTTVQGSCVTIGDRVNLCSKSKYTALGVNHSIVLRTLRPGAAIVIGHDCGLSGTTICAESSVTIGDQCLIGANVVIADTDFHAIDPTGRRYNRRSDSIATRPVLIGSNVFIGANSVVLKGVTIGANSVVGAGSVVVKDVPANCVVAGNPAKFIKWL